MNAQRVHHHTEDTIGYDFLLPEKVTIIDFADGLLVMVTTRHPENLEVNATKKTRVVNNQS